MNTVALYSRFEASFESAGDYANPVQDVAVEVEFECAGTRVTTAAFWDGERNVTADWSMYDDDSTALQSLKVKAYSGTPVAITFQIGTVAGSTWVFALKNVLLPKPKFDYSGKRRVISFSGARAHDTTIGAKDAFQITVQ